MTQLRGRAVVAGWARWLTLAYALVTAVHAPDAAAKSAQKNVVKGVRVSGSGDTRDVIIETATEPTFTVFRLSDPMRVVIDVSGGDISKLDGPVMVDDGVVTQVATQQFNSDGFTIGRLIVGFNHDVSYDVKAEGTSIIVRSGSPGVRIERAVPPPAAPADLGAQARLEAARKDASALAEKASAERKAADQAAATARADKDEAARLAEAAKKAKAEADAAKADADARRKLASEAAERDRAKADEAARKAEERLAQLQAEQQKLALSQTEADRKATQAEQARKDAMQAAALADAKHKVRVAQLEEQVAQAQTAKSEADAATKRAEAAKKDADAAQKLALQSKTEADKARAETDAKLAAIATREKELAAREASVAKQLAAREASVAQQLAAREASISQREKALEVEPTLVSAVASSQAKTVGLQGVSRSGDAVLLALDGQVEFKVERVDNPPRLVVDLVDTARKVKRTSYGVDAPNVRRVRLGEHDGSVRAVFDLASADVEHDVQASDKGVKVTVRKVQARSPSKPSPTEEESAVAQLKKIDFQQNGEISRITLDLKGDAKVRVDDRSKKAWVLELSETHVEGALEKSLDTSAYGGAVRLVSTYQASRDPQVVNIVVQLSGSATQKLVRDNGKVVWEITGTEKAPAPVVAETAVTRTPQTAGFAQAAATVARTTMPAAPGTGRARRVSLNFKDADIVNVIRLIADVTGENIITSEDVKGKVTVRLRNVPWETALDTILKSKGYDKVRSNNILRISSAQQIQAEREAEVARQRANELIEEKVIKIITVNYATASEIVGQLKGLLSTRGTVQTDDRTNTIIVEDVRSNIERLVELVRRLDKQTPQVLIEARIVEASTNYSQALGVQWGGQSSATAATGNPTGLSFPGDVIITGANPAGAGSTAGVTTPANYAVNLPAAITTGGALGFVFGSAGGSQLLQLRLAALESKGSGRIISSPRVATLDNRTARIAKGVDIPITVTSAAGANTRFVPANLELEVTPHVTNDGSILMRIRATRNEPNFARTGAFGDPTIERREAQTEVLVQDGDTTVIGGIYTRNTTRQYSQVPVLSQIPVLGWLFKSRADQDNKSELLIFVSPRIVNRQESVVASGESMSGGG